MVSCFSFFLALLLLALHSRYLLRSLPRCARRNWDTDPGSFKGDDDCLTPQFKPAEDVLRRYYRTTAPKPSPPSFPALCIGDGKCTC